jgi:hypothetical protein
MRIDAWLAESYASLAEQQADALAAQQKEALVCLSPQVRAMVPDQIVSASILLNAAYALFCDRMLGTEVYHVPYAASGFVDLAHPLLASYDDISPDPSADRGLVDRWATEIGLSGMYEWLPLSRSVPSIS